MSGEAIRKAAKKWFYQSFDDDLLEKMQKHGLIAQAEGFSISVMAELEVEMEQAFTNELAALREELAEFKRVYIASTGREVELKKSLTAAEQRNAELVELLRDIYNQNELSAFDDRRILEVIDAATKPTESGASE